MDFVLSGIIVILLVTSGVYGQGTLERQTCSAEQTETVIQADAGAVIGGLVTMHQEGTGGYGCGSIAGDMQSYEAIRWAIELLNKEKVEWNGEFLTDTYVPGIKIGMKVQDYCSKPSTAASKADSFFPALSTDALSCTKSASNLTLGIIGAENSDDTKEVSKFGANFDIPVISFAATASKLTKSPDYPTFMRTIPPDSHLMGVIVSVLKKIKWTYLVVVYTDNTYGRESLDEIRPRLNDAGICLTTAIQTPPSDVRDKTIDSIILQITDLVDDKNTDSVIGVIYLGSIAVANALLKRAPKHYSVGSGKIQWIFTDSISLNANFGSNIYPRGMLVVVPASRFIVEFEDHWVRINETEVRAENPWFQQWYEKEYGCSLKGPFNKCILRTEEEKRKAFTQDVFVEPAVHAVFAYARALRDAQQDKCGKGSSGVCADLLQMQSGEFLRNYLMKVDFTYSMDERIASMASYEYEPYKAAATLKFDANGDIEDPKFDIWNFNDVPIRGVQGFRFRKVGSYVNNYLDINVNNIRMYHSDRTKAFTNLPVSSCPSIGCKACLGDPISSKYLFMNGDIVINGIFTLHWKGTSPYSCGAFDTSSRSGAQAMEAFVYALKNVKRKFGNILNGVELGGLAFDDCYNPSYGPSFISQVQKGSLHVQDLQGNTLKPLSVDAYVASHTSTLTLPVADLLNKLEHPLVGYASGTTVLDDETKYPYYIRSHEGIAQQVPTIIYLLKKYKWYHIQTVVVSSDAYSMNGNDELKRLGAKEGICIVAENELDDDVVMKLRRRSSVKPVVIIALQQHNRKFLELIAAANAGGEFVIIGSATWGNSMQVIDGLESVADGIITLKGRRYYPTSFYEYLKNLRVDTNKINPWFAEWYEVMHECHIGPDNPRGYVNNCTDVANTPITEGKNFNLDEYTMFIINAVYAIAYGLDKTLTTFCGQNYRGVCGNYINADNQVSVLMENIRKATFNIDDTNPVEMFRFFGNSADIPYDIYNYRSNGNKYIKVMEYKVSTKEFRNMLGTEVKIYGGASAESVKPTCPGFCPECMYMFHSQKYMYTDGDFVIVGIFDVHQRDLNPFGCGSLRDVNGFQYTEAFNFAIDYINSGNLANFSMIRSGFKLGGLLLDGCTSPERSTTIVSSLLGGLLNLKTSDNKQIRIRNFRGFLTYDSQSTINIGEMLSPVMFPVVSPAATSPVLMDKTRFSTLFRTIPSDKHIAKAMADLAKAMGWTHVMTLNAPDTSSRDTLKEFRKLIKDESVCILASFEFVTDGSPTLIMQSMAQVKTQVVIVFAEPDMHIGDLLKANKALSPMVKFIYVANRYWDVAVDPQNGFKDVISKSIFFQIQNPNINAFMNHMMKLDPRSSPNPWLAEYYEKVKGCSLDGTTPGIPRCASPAPSLSGGDFKQDMRVLSTINAVIALARGIDDALSEACGGHYDSTCSTTFDSILKFLDIVRFKDLSNRYFEFIEREANRGFIMQQYNTDGGFVSPQKVGSYWNGLNITDRLFLNSEFSKLNISGTCGDECREICIPSSTNFKDFTYIYGDIFLVGLFDIHHKGKDNNPYGCSSINNKHGYQLLEAFHFALEFVNDKKGIFKDLLPGVDVGGIGLDVCQNPLRAGNLVANIHSKNIKLQQGTVRPNPDYFDMYIGPFDSESAIRVADVLSPISIPQITYGATSLELQNQYKYRYFLRSVPADDKQARAIISYLKRWGIDNVQIISSFDSVGQKGTEEFIRLAYLNRICVSQNITVGEEGPVTTSEAQEALNLVKTNAYGRVVVLFVDNPTPILEVVNTMKEIYEGYFFIGTDKWGFDNDLLAKIPNLIKNENAMTLDIETADVPEFDLYLENKKPNNYARNNSWFLDAFQEAHRCYLSDTSKSKYPRPCSVESDFGISRADNYVQDPYVLYVVNAVFSAAIGIHNALKELCGTDYYGICSLFLTSGERRERIFHGTQQVNFTDHTKQPFYFTKTGESDRGYHLYKPEMLPQSSDYQYTNIGSYNDTHFLKLWIEYGINESSVCMVNNDSKCPCVFPDYKPSRYMLVDEPFKQFDLNLVYVGAVHDRDPKNQFECGPIFSDWHFQQIMAFFYAIDLVNKDRNLPGSIKLGGLALDTCNQPMRLGQDMYSLLSGTALCNGGSVGQVIAPKTIVSVIPFSSHNSILLSGMLSPLKITMISPAATSVELSNKHYHPYFLRTVPPDNIQALLMLEVLKSFGWNYATVVYSDSVYGRSAVKALLASANTQATRACIANKIELAGDLTLAEAEQAVDKVSQQVGANVVILFVEPHQIRLLLQATRNKGLTGRFVWLASDYWGSSHAVTKGLEEEARGAISIQIRSENVKGFIDYMTSLTLENRANIPNDWFEEFYQTIHNCRLLNSVVTTNFPKICSGQERITEDMVKQDNYILSTIISVFMVAYGLNNIEACQRLPIDVSACLALQQDQRRDMIFNGIKTAQWAVLPEDLKNNSFQFRFTDEGYGDVRYNILNYYRNSEKDQYVYQQIGYYKNGLTLHKNLYNGAGNLDRGVYPTSKCPSGPSCQCLAANGITLIPYLFEGSITGSGSVIKTDWSYFDVLTDKEVGIPMAKSRFPQIWALVVATLAGIGVFVSVCMFIYLLVVYPVRGGTSILGFILAFGIILMYALVFAFIAHADEQICALRRFCLGLVYAICFSALLVKLIDCWRGRSKDEVKYSKLGRPCGLFMIVLLLIGVQIIISAEWLILVPPTFDRVLYNQLQWPRCSPIDFYDLGLVLSLIYVMILIVLCVIFGFASFKKSKNHHESRWILGIAVLSIPTFVIWCLVATIGALKVRDAAVAIGLLINATIMLLCGPLRKLWLLSIYQQLIEEEELEYEKERGNDYEYASTYGHQYDNAPRLHEGSVRGHFQAHYASSQPHYVENSSVSVRNAGTSTFTSKTVSQPQTHAHSSSVVVSGGGVESRHSEGATVIVTQSSQTQQLEGSTVVMSGGQFETHTSEKVPVIETEPIMPQESEGTTVAVSGGEFESQQSGGTVVIQEGFEPQQSGDTVIITEPQQMEGGVVVSGGSFQSQQSGGTVVIEESFEPQQSGGTVVIQEGFEPQQSGDTVIITEPQQMEGGGFEPQTTHGGTVTITETYDHEKVEDATVVISEGGFQPHEDSFQPHEDSFQPHEDSFQPHEDSFDPQDDKMSTVILPDDAPPPQEDPAVFISGSSQQYDDEGTTVFVRGDSQPEQTVFVESPSPTQHRVEVTTSSSYHPYEDIDMRG